MQHYRFLLFDADGTLFDFDRCEEEALKAALGAFSCPAGPEAVQLYHEINAGLWEQFNKGEIDRGALLGRRFVLLCDKLSLPADPDALNREYMNQLSHRAYLLDGAEAVLRTLAVRYRLFIITNGATFTQRGRFAASSITPLFEKIFISEEMGVQKPQKAFFDAVAKDISGFSPDKALVIGDSPSSDIAGAMAAGIDSCWYNPGGTALPGGLSCRYTVDRLSALLSFL